MECPHVNENAKIETLNISEDVTKESLCAGCSSKRQLWICLRCSAVNCGRYVHAHALKHYECQKDHSVCMDWDSLAVFCYECNDYIVNDTAEGLISRLREEFLRAAKKGLSSWPSQIISESDPLQTRRNLRPRNRKRSHSNDSSSAGSTENVQINPRGNRERRKDSVSNNHRRVRKIQNKREKRVVGLRNLGNTCFMNAVLQSLSNIEEFSLYFKKLPSLESLKNRNNKLYQSRTMKELKDAIMAEELRKILINLTDQGGSGGKGAISPESLFLVIWKVVPRYRGYQHQDAHEFLRYMLDRLHTELLHLLPESTLKDSQYISHKNKSSIVTSVFGGTLQSEVRCLNCGTESKKHDPFLDLSLDIPESCVNQRKCKDTGEDLPPCNILDCLTSFIEVEELAETELYYCSNCKSKQRSTKRFWIRRLPNVLCLHLKRFRWNNFFRTKVDTHVKFPVIALDMSQFVLSDLPDTRSSGMQLYDLAAVIVHHGPGTSSGHYTAFAINDGQWFHFNDSTVRPSETEVVAKCKPYILFYIKREFRLPTVRS